MYNENPLSARTKKRRAQEQRKTKIHTADDSRTCCEKFESVYIRKYIRTYIYMSKCVCVCRTLFSCQRWQFNLTQHKLKTTGKHVGRVADLMDFQNTNHNLIALNN